MSFTFEKDFSIKYCENGGYVVNQSNFIDGHHKYFEQAFSNLADLTNFLLKQKAEFEHPLITTEPCILQPMMGR